MNDKSLSIAFTVEADPDQVYAAVNDVRSWWSGEIDGTTDQLGSTFTYTYEDKHHSTQLITELIPGELVIWHVVEGRIRFVKDETEWTDTAIRFDIIPHGPHTEVRFTHIGLSPDSECFDSCSNAWSYYVGARLRNRIRRGRANPI
jgi:hypothetical protein